MWLLILKKTITLLALIEPFSVIPIYLATVEGLPAAAQRRFARALGITVTVALLVSGLLGLHLLSMVGVSLDGMRVGGGLITLLIAIAMVVGQEKAVKQGHYDASASIDGRGASIVPLGIPLLVGPATLAYSMVTSSLGTSAEVGIVVIPSLICGLITWGVFASSQRASGFMTPSMRGIVERLSGFLLAGLAVDLIATGMLGLFPALKGAGG